MIRDENPLVSVVIPTFQESKFLIEAINSVLIQTYSNIQLIIVDDNNGENKYREATRDKIRKGFPGQSFDYVLHDRNRGLSAARNTGILQAKGEFIAFLDDDDLWIPEKIEEQVSKFVCSDSQVGLIYSGYFVVNVLGDTINAFSPKYKGRLSDVLGVNHVGPPSSVMVKSSVLKQVGGFREKYTYRSDLELYYRISKVCLIEFISRPLMKYRMHEENMSKNAQLKFDDLERFIDEYKMELIKSKRRWSEILERKGELAGSLGKKRVAIRSFLSSFVFRWNRLQILAKLLMVIFRK